VSYRAGSHKILCGKTNVILLHFIALTRCWIFVLKSILQFVHVHMLQVVLYLEQIFFKGVLGTRFGSLQLKIGSLESQKSGSYRSIAGT